MFRESERGFSFVEILMVTSVLAFVTAGTQTFVSHFRRGDSNERTNEEVALQGRAATDRMVGELRLACDRPRITEEAPAAIASGESDGAAASFLVTAPTRVVFEADLDGDGVVERIEYRLNGTVLERSAVSKNSDGSVPPSQYETLAENVSNGPTPLFSYAVEPPGALLDPGNVESVRVSLLLRPPISGAKNHNFRVLVFEGFAYRQDPQS